MNGANGIVALAIILAAILKDSLEGRLAGCLEGKMGAPFSSGLEYHGFLIIGIDAAV